MTQPAVTITELDGALGNLATGGLLALIGTSSMGPIDLPATFARIADVQANFGTGPLVEAAARAIDLYGQPVCVVRAAAGGATDGTYSAVDSTGVTGTAVPTVDATVKPYDSYDVRVNIVTGGTVGVAGIQLTVSLDGGITTSQLYTAGVANFILITEANVKISLGAGTLVAGDWFTVSTFAPNPDSTTYLTALTALGNSLVSWRVCAIVGTVDAATAGSIDQKFVGFQAAHKPRYFIANTRLPDFIAGETEAAYLSSLSAAFHDFATTFGSIAAGAVQLPSSVSGRQYKVPVSYAAGPLIASVDEDVDVADINLGSIPGARLADTNGNPILGLHNESLNPGLDDARFLTLRTWVGVEGVYVNRPRVMSATGSDFYLVPHRLIMNLGEDALYQYLIRRLNQGVQVNKKTGYILESVALEIEAGGTAAMTAVLLAKPKASDCSFKLSRFDNVLSTKTLTGEARILPFGYVEYIETTIGYVNPALRVLTAA
jgi:hypothetical protein